MPGFPCCIAENVARPCSSSAQTSPSSTAFGVRSAFPIAFATSAKRAVKSLSFRLTSATSPPATYAIAR